MEIPFDPPQLSGLRDRSVRARPLQPFDPLREPRRLGRAEQQTSEPCLTSSQPRRRDEPGEAGIDPREAAAENAALRDLVDRVREAPEPELSVPDPDGDDV